MMTQPSTNANTTPTTNWKNVNNWHWVEKNCLPWAQDYLSKSLQGLEVKSNGHLVKIDSCKTTGDVDLNQRKGKLITIYDLVLDIAWKGSLENGKEAQGRVSIPEFMHDSGNDFECTVSVDSCDADKEILRKLAREKLVPAIKEKLQSFSQDLVASHSNDVVIPKENMNGHPTLESYTPKPPVPVVSAPSKKSTSSDETSSVAGSLVTVNQEIEFVCSASDLYDTLLEPSRVMAWTRGKAIITPTAGSEFYLFDGNVTGKLLELEKNVRIIMNWRLKSWPSGHYSKVTLELDQKSESTLLKLKQQGVPVGIKDLTMNNWNSYYWQAIKSTFGYGFDV